MDKGRTRAHKSGSFRAEFYWCDRLEATLGKTTPALSVQKCPDQPMNPSAFSVVGFSITSGFHSLCIMAATTALTRRYSAMVVVPPLTGIGLATIRLTRIRTFSVVFGSIPEKSIRGISPGCFYI